MNNTRTQYSGRDVFTNSREKRPYRPARTKPASSLSVGYYNFHVQNPNAPYSTDQNGNVMRPKFDPNAQKHYCGAPLTVLESGRGHPLYFNVQGNTMDVGYSRYRSSVRAWLLAHKEHPNTLVYALHYVNFLEHEARYVIIDEMVAILNACLVHVDILTVLHVNGDDVVRALGSIYIYISLTRRSKTVHLECFYL